MTKLKLQNGIGARCSVIARFLHPRRMLSRYVEVCWLLCNSFHWWRKHSWRGRRNSAFAILNFCDASYLIKNYICWLTSHDKLHIKQIRFVCSTKPCVYYWIILYFKVACPHFLVRRKIIWKYVRIQLFIRPLTPKIKKSTETVLFTC